MIPMSGNAIIKPVLDTPDIQYSADTKLNVVIIDMHLFLLRLHHSTTPTYQKVDIISNKVKIFVLIIDY